MDFDRGAWFLAGLIVGNLLSTPTTLILFSVWLVISNHRLPVYLGGIRPQDLLTMLVTWLGLLFRRFFPIRQQTKDEPVSDAELVVAPITAVATPVIPSTMIIGPQAAIVYPVGVGMGNGSLQPQLLNQHQPQIIYYGGNPRVTIPRPPPIQVIPSTPIIVKQLSEQ